METKIFEIYGVNTEREKILAVAEILRRGGLAAIPTETVYGLAANALDERAVAKIFKAKGRPQDNPLIVHIPGFEMLPLVAREIPAGAELLAEKYWPGPLTLVLPAGEAVPEIVTAGLGTVAVRMPGNDIAREIIAAAGIPLAAPSANLSGRPSPTTAGHCAADLFGRIDAIVRSHPCEIGIESTVVSLAGRTPELLRPGAITPKQLEADLGEIILPEHLEKPLDPGKSPASPGMKYRHYSPRARLLLVDSDYEGFVEFVRGRGKPGAAALVFDGEGEELGIPFVSYGPESSPEKQASGLFSALRRIDELEAEDAYVRSPGKSGIGFAVYNRLLRAAGFKEIRL